jgi:hypothetical protein
MEFRRIAISIGDARAPLKKIQIAYKTGSPSPMLLGLASALFLMKQAWSANLFRPTLAGGEH